MEEPSNKSKFIQKMKKTQFARINAAKRCDSWNNFLTVILFSYNLIIVVGTVCSLVIDNLPRVLNILLVITSVLLFGVSLFVSTKDFQGKAKEYTNCFNEIVRMIKKAEEADETGIKQIEESYDLLMSSSINHRERDYFKYVYEYPDDFSEAPADMKRNARRIVVMSMIEDIFIKSLLTCFVYLIVFSLRWFLFAAFTLINRLRKNKRKKQ